MLTGKICLECSPYFSVMHLIVFYIADQGGLNESIQFLSWK